MKGLSKKEIQVVAELEFRKKYYFTAEDIIKYFKNKKQMINTIYTLKKKGRVFKLSKKKYFLIPIKARKGKWTDHPLVIVDEMFNGKDYFVGSWYAAHYWGLTEQVPMQVDVYNTKRQGEVNLLNNCFRFRRTTKKRIKEQAILRKIGKHTFKILNRRQTKKWLESRE